MSQPLPSLEIISSGVGRLGDLDRLAGRPEEVAVATVKEVVDEAFTQGVYRVEAAIGASDFGLKRVLQRSGLRPEGVARGAGTADPSDGIPVDLRRMARLADDPPPGTRAGFLSMLNATLPTKRVIAQGIIRDNADRVLLCELTYKQEWDLPGGVADPGESPVATLAREVSEELGVSLPVGDLLAVNWLPPYRQWEDALLLVFDLGEHPDLTQRVVKQSSEIAAVHWCALDQVGEHVAPYVARHVASLRPVLAGEESTVLLEDGQRLA